MNLNVPANARSEPIDPARARKLALAALGVVYGDIGTSPLYALRECFHGPHAIPTSQGNVVGVLSLILWSLILVVTIKYLVFILRADNRGEGGILALLALVTPTVRHKTTLGAMITLGLFGAALLYGDGVITPAISVLSALEGLKVAAPALEPYVIPIAIVILIALFRIQRRGSAFVGGFFGPVTLVWFITLAVLGVVGIVGEPMILEALSPHHAVSFFVTNGWRGFTVLGSVFLVVTGGEALYADMGHFGRPPIRRAWFIVVLPALMLNYLGQGALLLRDPDSASSPFFHLAPTWALYPLIALSTLATVIASQAVITGAFSVTWQAIQLGYLPRFHVLHTSEDEMGQVFLPRINNMLLIATIALVVSFRTSSNLAAAYGIAVTTTMVITTLLAFVVMRRIWKWGWLPTLVVSGSFLVLDLGFLGANMLKIADGGWLPLALGGAILVVMLTWRDGRRLLAERLKEREMSFDELASRLESNPPARTPGTAIYMAGNVDGMPPALWRTLRQLHVLHERVVILRVQFLEAPYAPDGERCSIEVLPIDCIHRMTVRYGFMEKPNIPRLLRTGAKDLPFDPEDVIYVLGRETLLATERPGMALWREELFSFLSRNGGRATEFFRLPSDKVIEIGAQIEL